jgi:hypothetical protein
MIPRRPYADDLTIEEELAQFERLKPQLERVWTSDLDSRDEPLTSVVVPSLTLDEQELVKLQGGCFYEERLLFMLMRLRNPHARVVYLTSMPIQPMVIDYYLQLLAGIPASHARNRLTLLCAYDSSARALSAKILDRPRLLERIRSAISDRSRATLTVFNSTPLERKLAVLLGIPLEATDPSLVHLGDKTHSKQLFRDLGIPVPEGAENLHSREEVEAAIVDLTRIRPGLRRVVVKLNESFSGEGNAVVTLPEKLAPAAIGHALEQAEFSVASETPASYYGKFSRMGGIVEEMIEAEGRTSPSVQVLITPHREVRVVSTHEQILGGQHKQVYLGCDFPSDDAYRIALQDIGSRVGDALAARGVIGRFSVDFLAWPRPDQDHGLAALEINLRAGGTTHPMLALDFLTGGTLDPVTGKYYGPDGLPKYYRASDNLKSDNSHGLAPEDLIEIVTVNRMDYSYRTGTGVLFHMFGAVSQYGKMGMIAIGNSRDEARTLFRQAMRILDREAAMGRNRKQPESALVPESAPAPPVMTDA